MDLSDRAAGQAARSEHLVFSRMIDHDGKKIARGRCDDAGTSERSGFSLAAKEGHFP
jgi:hypothetical protein